MLKSMPRRLRIPAAAFAIVKEAARHLLRRPIVGIAAAARAPDGRWLLIRRADMDDWALPGGTLEWGETLRDSIARELVEEAGVDGCEVVRLVGVFSRPDRDPRFHGVTIVVECTFDGRVRGPQNPLEIREARLFAESEIPTTMAMGMQDMIGAALRSGPAVLE
jgi:8-oxo-dGTP diphosphatase